MQDIKRAARTGKQPYPANRTYLLTVSSPSTRAQIYKKAELALADFEVNLLPYYGGRSWNVEVKISDPPKGKSPYFVFEGGNLELACFPILLHRIPNPPRFVGQKRFSSDEDGVSVSDEMEYIYELQEREITPLSELAQSERWRVPFPTVSVRWISPLREIFQTRKQAWERASELARNEASISRTLKGLDAAGRPIKPSSACCTKALALKVGKLRFERDGLWVIGQEESWRNSVNGEGRSDNTNATSTKGLSPLAYYLMCNREELKRKRLDELKSAKQNISVAPSVEESPNAEGPTPKKELPVSSRDVAVVSPSPARSVVNWVSGLMNQFEAPTKDIVTHSNSYLSVNGDSPPEQVSEDDGTITQGKSISNQNANVVDDSSSKKATSSSFTLRDAEKELRLKWKELAEEERQEWKRRACSHNEEQEKQEQLKQSVHIQEPTGTTESPQTTAPSKQKHSVSNSRWCLSQEQIDTCYRAGVEHYDQVMRTVQSRDLVRELKDGFDLLRERGNGRFDMELPIFDTEEFAFLTDPNKTPWMPVVHQILGKNATLIHKGMFLSMPGAETQVYHQDGTHLTDRFQKPCHAINVFVPLVDLEMQNGPTHFCLGSHILGNEDFNTNFSEIPTPSAGTPIIFDYRLFHYGMANNSLSCRPILYCTYAAASEGKEFRDKVNFSRKRYHRIGDLVSKVPSREERAQKRSKALEEDLIEKAKAESLQ